MTAQPKTPQGVDDGARMSKVVSTYASASDTQGCASSGAMRHVIGSIASPFGAGEFACLRSEGPHR
jgi:hypothetical protein